MPGPERLSFLDTLRLVAILAVLALHAGIAYAPLVPWWYVADAGKNAAFNLLLVVTDGFVMPTLFAIAGYFALPSLERRGPAGFLLAKAKRLGLPLVAVTMTLCPIISYIVFLGQGGTAPYWRYWLRLLPTALAWHPRVLADVEDVSGLHTHLWSFHLWFLGMLLLFCVLLVLGRGLWPRRGGRSRTAGFRLFLGLALLVGVAEAVGQTLIGDAVWVSLGPFFVCQAARVPLYLGMFGLGLFAWRRGWFTRYRLPGRPWLWAVLAGAGFGAMIATGLANLAPDPKPVWIPFGHGLARTGFALAATGLLVAVGQRYWNRPGGLCASLAAASYDIYLAHLPLMVVLQYWLAHVAVSPFVKFAVVFLATTGICYGASRLAARSRRIWVPAGTLAAFGLCLLAWG